jgi:hypothetical protein
VTMRSEQCLEVCAVQPVRSLKGGQLIFESLCLIVPM